MASDGQVCALGAQKRSGKVPQLPPHQKRDPVSIDFRLFEDAHELKARVPRNVELEGTPVNARTRARDACSCDRQVSS
jgi:hypothetical protein